jgi:hypothetical protein
MCVHFALKPQFGRVLLPEREITAGGFYIDMSSSEVMRE